MKRLFTILFVLALAFSATAQSPTNRISLTISITNIPVTGNNLVVNSSTRTWTNASSSTTILTNLVSTAGSATNLYNEIAGFPYSGGIFPRWLSETSMVLTAPLGGALAASQSGAWAVLTLSTQSGPQTFTALWPIENIVVASNRTNQASSFVGGLSQFSTNAFATNSTAGSNFLTKGASPVQDVTGPVRFGGRTAVSSGLYATNGFTSGLTNINPVFSNAVNYGNAIRSEGSGGNSLQVGSNATALGTRTVAIGNGALATNNDATAIGTSAIATNRAVAVGNAAVASGLSVALGNSASAFYDQSLAIGGSSVVSAQYGIAIGDGASASSADTAVGRTASAAGTNSLAMGVSATVGSDGLYSTAIGAASSSTHSNATVIGAFAASTGSNQVLLGTSSDWIQSPGVFAGNIHTNTILKGTNVINGRVDFTSRNNTGLANGNNAGVVLGSNVFVRLSGATTIAYLGGFAAEQDGSFHILRISGSITNTFGNESGVDPTAANRIITGTGGDLSYTNNPLVIGIIYDATSSRWNLMGVLR